MHFLTKVAVGVTRRLTIVVFALGSSELQAQPKALTSAERDRFIESGWSMAGIPSTEAELDKRFGPALSKKRISVPNPHYPTEKDIRIKLEYPEVDVSIYKSSVKELVTSVTVKAARVAIPFGLSVNTPAEAVTHLLGLPYMIVGNTIRFTLRGDGYPGVSVLFLTESGKITGIHWSFPPD